MPGACPIVVGVAASLEDNFAGATGPGLPVGVEESLRCRGLCVGSDADGELDAALCVLVLVPIDDCDVGRCGVKPML